MKEIVDAKPRVRKQMLLNAPPQLFTTLKILCKLVNEGMLNLGKARRYKKIVTKMSKTKASALKGMVKQHGGIFGSIISGVLPFITPLISKLFK